MDRIEKLFKKISQKERTILVSLINDLLNRKRLSGIKKLKGSEFYRLKKGKLRIIFHYDSSKNIIIDSIRLRRENTYKDF